MRRPALAVRPGNDAAHQHVHTCPGRDADRRIIGLPIILMTAGADSCPSANDQFLPFGVGLTSPASRHFHPFVNMLSNSPINAFPISLGDST